MPRMIRHSACRTLGLLPGLALIGVAAAQNAADLPDAATVLDRAVEAAGGRDAFERLQSFTATGSVEIPAAGVTGSMSIFREGGNYYIAIAIPGVGTTEAGVTDGIAWESAPAFGARIKTGTERSQALRDAAMAINAAVDWRESFSRAETVGSSTIDGEAAYEVRMTPAEGGSVSMHFSKESGLALRMDLVAATQMGEVPIQVTYGNYREFGGVLVPTVRASSVVGATVTQIIESAQTNVEIPEGRFDLPEAVAALVE